MAVPVETPDILQLINQLIINLVGLIRDYGEIIMMLSLLGFVVWFLYQVGVLIYELAPG